MTKIYEALNYARKEREGVEKLYVVPQPGGNSLITSDLEMEEEMVGLYQTIDSLLPDSQKKIIQFMGSIEGEGASTIIREFAKVAAVKFRRSVLLLDADVHKPTQHLFFKTKSKDSWADVIKHGKPFDKVFFQVEKSRLFVSTISEPSSSAIKVFDFLRNTQIWEKLRQRFDLILVDSPPGANSSDGPAISCKMDGVVLVLEAEKTRWPVAESVKDKIMKNGGKILGIVFNKQKYHIPEFIYKRL